MAVSIDGSKGLPDVNGPCFSGQGSSTVISSAATMVTVTYTNEIFDTNNCFNPATGVFQPNIAGYYQINGSCNFGGSSTGFGKSLYLRKNASSAFAEAGFSTTDSNPWELLSTSGLIFLNGTTDYVVASVYASSISSGTITLADAYFSGFLARLA